jgi:hypothetical protein
MLGSTVPSLIETTLRSTRESHLVRVAVEKNLFLRVLLATQNDGGPQRVGQPGRQVDQAVRDAPRKTDDG